MPTRLTRAIRGATDNPAVAIALAAGAAALAVGVGRYLMQLRDRWPTENTLPTRDELESNGPAVISESEDFTTPGTVEIEVARAVTVSADSAEGAAHVPGGKAPRRRNTHRSRHGTA